MSRDGQVAATTAVESVARALRSARDRRTGDEVDFDFRRALAVEGLQALDALVEERKRLAEALTYYAEGRYPDNGELAREALAR